MEVLYKRRYHVAWRVGPDFIGLKAEIRDGTGQSGWQSNFIYVKLILLPFE